jgi:hypothetical protein
VITGKFKEKGFPILEVLPVLRIEFDRYNPAGWHVVYRFVAELVDKIADAVIVTEDYGRIESVVKRFYGLDEISVAETV